MTRHKLPATAAAVAWLCLAQVAPAAASTIRLTFDQSSAPGATMACTGADGGLTDRFCTGNSQFIGSDYGSTLELGVSYDPSLALSSLRTAQFHFVASVKGAFGQSQTGNELSEILFTPAAGFEVSLTSFRYGSGTATFNLPRFEIVDASNSVIFLSTPGSSNDSTLSPSTAYFSGPLTFRFGTTSSGAVVVDDITLDVRGVATAVPEPGALALMGTGLAGLARLRGRRRGLHRRG